MNKGGYVYVMDRKTGELVNTWPLSENINWVKSVNPKTGELSGRDQPEIGEAGKCDANQLRQDNQPHGLSIGAGPGPLEP